MYILIDSSHDIVKLHDAYNQIRNEYSSILKEYGLSLNTKKCCLKPAIEINDELKKSLYDEYFNGIHHDIEELFEGKFQDFLSSLLLSLKEGCIDVEHYNFLIDQHFNSDDIPYNNKGVMECQFQIGYKGLIDLSYRNPQMQIISAQAVYENDVFEYELGLNPKLEHRPALEDRGEVRLFYGMFKLVNGGYGFEVMGDIVEEEDEVMYVLTNKEKYFGAAGIFFCAELFQKVIGTNNFYILPSSVHELILVKDDEGCDMQGLSAMVRCVNEEQVDMDERLSDHAYYYDWKQNKVIF